MSSLVRLRWMIFDAMAIDRSTASRRISRRRATSRARSGARRCGRCSRRRRAPCFHLLAGAGGVGAGARDDRVGFGARLDQDARRLSAQTLQLLPRLAGVVERLADRLLAPVERVEQRPPGELGEQRHQHTKRRDGPDIEPGIGLDQRVVHRRNSFPEVRRLRPDLWLPRAGSAPDVPTPSTARSAARRPRRESRRLRAGTAAG